MGGSSSKVVKVVRKLPTKPTASWAGARMAPPSASSGAGNAAAGPSREALASESKSAAIREDAGDPDFVRKLNALGPVKVDHHMSSLNARSTHMQQILASRQTSEAEAASHAPPRNRLLASALSDALEARKHLTDRSPEGLKKLAARHNIDAEVLERLAGVVTTPSEVEGSRRKVVDEEGQERYTVLAGWVDSTTNGDARPETR